MWRDCEISEGHNEWDKMTCDHVDPHKRVKHSDPLDVPIAYMESQGTFKAIKTSKYGLSCFYQVGVMEDFPTFPEPLEPKMSNDVCCLLKKACEWVQPNLVVAFSQDAVTVIALLCNLLHHVSLQQLKMQMDKEAGDQPSWRLSFCPFCQYSGSNDQSYLNHIMCVHYCAN